MKKTLIFAMVAVVFVLIFGAWYSLTEDKKTVAVVEAKIKVPTQSVQEFAQRYKTVELTPSQRSLVKAGFYPDLVYSIEVKTIQTK